MLNLFARVLLASMLVVAAGLVCSPGARAQANVQGTWQTLPVLMPINPVHTALLSNGKILVVSGSGNYPAQTVFNGGVWDPASNTMTTQTLNWDMFCNGMVVLPDGRPFIMGGNLQYDPFHGWNRTAAFDPATGNFVDMENMAHGRWYPTSTVLGDGRVMTFSGLDENGNTNSQVEIYKVGAGWAPPSTAPWTPPLYPRMHLLPNGKVFYSGWTTQSRMFDPSNNTWSSVIATTQYGGARTYGSSVLLPLTPANSYAPKVMIFGGGNPSTATTEIIDLSAATPAWVNGPVMSQPRIEMNATLLPNGKVLLLGGSLNDEDGNTASLQADLYDSATNTMGSAGANAFPRLYHSVSLLLPDGTVWVAGGNPTRGTYEQHIEIYTPPYLFQSDGTPATRPSITSVTPGVIEYGSAFTVQTADAANIASVVLMKDGAVTHAFNMDQRMVGLSFTAGSGVLNVTGPPNGNIAPPGYYMLFLIDNNGVPSVANFVQISTAPADVPPTGTITSPATDPVAIQTGQTVTFAATGSAPSGTIAGYWWSIRGGVPATSAVQNPGAVTFPGPGTFEAALTVTDNAGITDPSPKTRTITVTDPNPAPTLTMVAPNSGAQGNTSWPVVLTGTGFLANPACSFGAGIEINTCTFVSATEVDANVDVLAGAVTGPRDVTVTNTDTQSATLASGFSVVTGVVQPAPTLTGISPNSAFQGATNVAVTLTGTNFQNNPTCNFDADFGGTTSTCTFVSPTQINVNLSVAANAVLGGHNVFVTNPDGQSATLINGFTVTEDLGNTVKLGAGFTTGALVMNGNAQLSGSMLEITDGNQTERSAAWYATPVNVQSFVTDFTFQITPGTTADGFTFALQNNSTAALGWNGGSLGYGPVQVGDPPLIPNSIAVKFDLFDNVGEGTNSTGLYLNGDSPLLPAIDLTASGIDLHSGDTFEARLTYDGANLAMTLTDTVTNAVFSTSWPVDIPTIVGGTTAYAGFTGGTGGLSAVQNVLTWTLGPLTPAVVFSPVSPLDFPDTTVNSTSVTSTVTIKNGGSGTLHITTLTLAGTNPGDFALVANTCNGAAVTVNASCTVGVTFTPTGTGARQANLEVTDDAADSPQTLALTGNGLAATTPGVSIAPASPVMFPSTTQGATSAPATITVTNSGTATLNISTVTISGTNATDFAATANSCNGAAVGVNATCTLMVTFTPGGVGVRQATLQVSDNAPGSPQSATLTGTGNSSTGNAPVVTISPVSENVAATQGTTSPVTNLTIKNTGGGTLNISAVAFGGANVAEFVNPANPCVGTPIAPNGTCTIGVSFAPVGSGSRSESITITDNATNSPQVYTFGATAAPLYTVTSGASALSATVTAGQTAQYSLQLTPGVGYTGAVTMVCSGAPATTTCTVANPIQLTSGSTTTFSVSVTTTARGVAFPRVRMRPIPPFTLPVALLVVACALALLALRHDIRIRFVPSRQLAYCAGIAALLLCVYAAAGCASGGGGSTTPPPTTGTQKGTYTLTLTPTANSMSGKALQLSPITLTLTVN
ncbi:MAG TPA: choice-of-anchor D domain-containing protein [Candidatus Acidoferrum sp.]